MARVLLCGFGFMGRLHADVLGKLPGVNLVGVFDPRGAAIHEDLHRSGCAAPVFTELEKALEETACEVVDICLPTDLHRRAAETALNGRRHVFCEKPLALTVADAEAMVRAAREAGRELMVGHCIRFWPEYEILHDLVRSGDHGTLVSLCLSRRNARPDYAVGGWTDDPARCVGAALDMHIHDTDFVCHLLGTPRAVSARGLREPTGWNSIASFYDFGPDGPLVFADGAWNYPPGWGFQMKFSAVFERGALDYDSRGEPTLLLTVGKQPPHPVAVPTDPADGYHAELAYFFSSLREGQPVEKSTGDQAAESLRVTLAEIESAARGGRAVSLQ
jgi:predicted dehydrogenase